MERIVVDSTTTATAKVGGCSEYCELNGGGVPITGDLRETVSAMRDAGLAPPESCRLYLAGKCPHAQNH